MFDFFGKGNNEIMLPSARVGVVKIKVINRKVIPTYEQVM